MLFIFFPVLLNVIIHDGFCINHLSSGDWKLVYIKVSLQYNYTQYIVRSHQLCKMAPLLYSLDASPPCRTVLMAAKALSLPLNVQEINLQKNEHFEEKYLKVRLKSLKHVNQQIISFPPSSLTNKSPLAVGILKFYFVSIFKFTYVCNLVYFYSICLKKRLQ